MESRADFAQQRRQVKGGRLGGAVNIVPCAALPAPPGPALSAGCPAIVSVVTPVLNRASMIARALDSVAAHPAGVLEHIVADGGSTDGTLDLLRARPGLRVLSGPDANAHEAMNKGVAAARGDVIGFLNSDDEYGPGILAAVARRFAAEPALDVLSVRAFVLRLRADGGRDVVSEIRHATDPECLWGQLLYGAPAINSWFFRRGLFDRFGGFDPGLEVAADRAFLIRLAAAGVRPVHHAAAGYLYLSHPGSATLDPDSGRADAILDEHARIRARLLAEAPSAALARRVHRWAAYESLLRLVRQRRTRGTLRAVAGALRLCLRDPGWPRALAAALRRRRAFRACFPADPAAPRS